MEILIILVIGLVAYFFYKSSKQQKLTSQLESQNPEPQKVSEEDALADSIQRLREMRKSKENKKVSALEYEVKEKREVLNKNNQLMDKMGLRKSLCYILDEMKHWHAWKDNTPDFVEKYTSIDDFEFEDAREIKADSKSLRFEIDFKFNGKKFKIAHQSDGSFELTNFGFSEVFEETNGGLEKMLKMKTYMNIDTDIYKYDYGDVSFCKTGEWISALVSIEAGLEAIEKRTRLEFSQNLLDKDLAE